MLEKTGNLDFVERVCFEYMQALKNNDTKYFFFSDVFCEETCNSRSSVAIADAGIFCGLITIYIEQNFFHQNKQSLDFEFQSTHIVVIQSSCDVMQTECIIRHRV